MADVGFVISGAAVMVVLFMVVIAYTYRSAYQKGKLEGAKWTASEMRKAMEDDGDAE